MNSREKLKRVKEIEKKVEEISSLISSLLEERRELKEIQKALGYAPTKKA